MSRRKHAATVQAIFAQPVQASIPWRDIESLLESLGADIEEGETSVR